MSSLRRAIALLVCGCCLLLVQAASPVLAEPPLALPTDGLAGEALKAAREHIEAERWEDAIPLLQLILDGDQDVFVLAPTPKGTPERRVSARGAAHRLLGTLPQ